VTDPSGIEDSYVVVVNDEEQFSIWPADQEVPAGWKAVFRRGTKQECLAYVREHWTDMRPLSLRRLMDQQSAEIHP
jgi:MbtH protein